MFNMDIRAQFPTTDDEGTFEVEQQREEKAISASKNRQRHPVTEETASNELTI
jgi:hypothetical protein